MSGHSKRSGSVSDECSNAELVIDAIPASLDRLLRIDVPIVNARYRFVQVDGPELTGLIESVLSPPGE